MANITIAKKGGTVGTAAGGQGRFRLQHTIDIAKVNAALVAAGSAALASGDTIVLVDMPVESGFHIFAVKNNTALVLGTTPTISLGDVASATRYVNAATAVTAGTYHTVATTSFNYPTGGQVRFAISNAGGTITSGQITTFFEELDFRTLLPAQVL